MSHATERRKILEMLEAGQIKAEDAVRLLNALSGETPPTAAGGGAETVAPAAPEAEPAAGTPAPAPPDLDRWRSWWQVPFWIGAAITLAGGGLMYLALRAAEFQFSGWFLLAACPFALGVLVMALAAASRSARWIHIRVDTGQDEWPRRIALSFPLPIRLTAWFLRTFGHRIPELRRTAVDELILALGESATPETPVYVDVNEAGGGERVQVYIG